ncbi:MAG: aminopeptidase, partial [Alistipes sp.]|nr:aminopeptidase [Alistipes sp.]
MKKLFVMLLTSLLVLNVTAKEKVEGYKFTDGKLIKTTSVKNQFRSGTCWCFSALSFIENEIIRAGGEEM